MRPRATLGLSPVGVYVDTAETGAEPKHDQEVVRILGKMLRMRRIALGGGLALLVLGMLGLYSAIGLGGMLLVGAILGACLLVTLLVMVVQHMGTQNRLKASLSTRPPVSFHSPDGSYFFINQEGVFMEKSLWFVPFRGFSFVTDIGFDSGTRKLTIRIQNGRQSKHSSQVIIDVPPGFPNEPLEQISALSRVAARAEA
jgi:hypothetical protein